MMTGMGRGFGRGLVKWMLSLFCFSLLSFGQQDLPNAPEPQVQPVQEFHQRNFVSKTGHWMYRHPLITGVIVGAGVGLAYGLTHEQGCPKMIDGYPYNGYGRPCPYECNATGCEWPGGK
jgi:hypothetical protein